MLAIMAEPAVELRKVTKRFGGRAAVDGLDLSLPRGSLNGIIGPNGSGKTTTLRMILRILLPDAGTVRVLGRETGRATDARTGYLPEERGLYRRMKVAQVLAFFARLKGLRSPAAAVERWLDRLDLRERAHEKVESLSRGLAQKLQLAVALVHDPEVAILDEPFSGLDPVNVETLRSIVLDLRRAGTTVLFSTHDMDMAERLCDEVVMIHGGRKVLDGPVDAIKTDQGVETVRVRVEGDGSSLADLPGVVAVRDYGREQSLELAPGGDPQAVLAALLGRGPVIRFEVGRPSLHEIFVRIARPEPDGA